jgi:hypothetical protein
MFVWECAVVDMVDTCIWTQFLHVSVAKCSDGYIGQLYMDAILAILYRQCVVIDLVDC